MADDIVAANASTSGGGQVLSGTVESVIHSASYYDTPTLQASEILWGIVGNHTFVEGNKRTAVQACRSYAERVGLTVNKTDDEIMDVAGRVANGELDNVDDIAGALQ